MHTSISKWQKSQDEQSTVNAYIDIKAFHIHWNNHKSYKIYYYQHDNQKAQVLSWQSEKHKSNTVNTYINTKNNFTHIHLLYKCTQTPEHSVTPSQALERTHTHSPMHTHTHARTRTHTHIVRHTTHTHTHAQQMKEWRQQQALLLVPCFAAHSLPPPPHHPTPLLPMVTISETQVKALQKRCVLRLDLKDVRDGDNRVCIGTEFHTQGAWYWKDLAPALFKLTRGTQSSLSEDDRSDLWGVYEERQCERYGGNVPSK